MSFPILCLTCFATIIITAASSTFFECHFIAEHTILSEAPWFPFFRKPTQLFISGYSLTPDWCAGLLANFYNYLILSEHIHLFICRQANMFINRYNHLFMNWEGFFTLIFLALFWKKLCLSYFFLLFVKKVYLNTKY
jgi:hypothetical protein